MQQLSLPGVWRYLTFPWALPFDGRRYCLLRSLTGVQRGEAPLPRVWGCPPTLLLFPQEWGPRGLKRDFSDALMAVTGRRHGVFFRVDI